MLLPLRQPVSDLTMCEVRLLRGARSPQHETITHLGQFTRRKIDALLLHIRTRPLTDSLLKKALQLLRHLLDHMGSGRRADQR